MEKTITDAATYMGEKVKSAEIAFFGGSFTAIDREYMVALLESAHKLVNAYGFSGIRISTRPDKIDSGILDILKKHSVTSVELGAQSMCDEVLSANDRGHTAEDVRKASALIKSHGFELGLQMMTGLYKSNSELDLYTAQEIIKLKPRAVRIYPTITLENTRLADLYKTGEYNVPSLRETVELCAALIPMFENKGINVIRVGLHATDEITEKRIAGPYHPAFKELCLSEIYYQKILSELSDKEISVFKIHVNPRLLSAMIGQKRNNLVRFSDLGYTVNFVADENISQYEIRNR